MKDLRSYTHCEMPGSETVPEYRSDIVRAGLDRVNASSGFATSPRMCRFLSFVVEKTLSGEAETLKEYRVGIEVFDRGQDFDPRTDTIVRVEARRLRKKLEEYYQAEGRLDPVVIRLAAGGYVPAFEIRRGPQLRPSVFTRGRLGIALSFVLMSIALLLSGRWLNKRALDSRTPLTSIAVLPFVDMSAAKDQEYLCDGLSEELINALSGIPALKVAARTSAFRFKGKADDVRRVGAELAVEHIVEGSVRTSGKRLRVTAQLVRVRDGYHVWSRQFDREFTELFSIQDDVARAVAASVGAELGTSLSTLRPRSPEAYREYLEGRHYARQFVPALTSQAVAYFERSIAADPSFAPAHAGLAHAYSQMNVYGIGAPGELSAKARAAATRALHLNPTGVEAQTELGALSAFYDWDWKACEQHFRKAIYLQPNFVDAHWLFSTTCLAPQGRLDEALTEAERAVALDPLSPLSHTMLGATYWYRREFGKALDACATALRLDPSYSQALLFKSFVYLSQGRMDLAAGSQEQGPYRLYIQAKTGARSAAQAKIEQFAAAGGNPIAIAAGYAGLGRQDKSLDWLEKAVERKMPQMLWIHFQAAFEPLHETARYQAMRARMRLP